MKRRRLLAILLVAATLLALVAGGFVSYVSWRSADSLIHPARPASTLDPAGSGLTFERVAFQASDGVDLAGWWMPAPEPQGTVVFLHGYADSKSQSLRYAAFLRNASYNVLAFDFRAHGESAGDHTTVGLDETRDVAGALSYLDARGDVDTTRVALLGLSMGAATAINAAALSSDVRAVVADSSFAQLQNIASNSIHHFTGLPSWPFGPLAVEFASWMVEKDVEANAPARALASVAAPVLIIQGGADDIARASDDGEALRAAARAGDYWLVPCAAHVGAHLCATAEYESRVLSFLDAAFA